MRLLDRALGRDGAFVRWAAVAGAVFYLVSACFAQAVVDGHARVGALQPRHVVIVTLDDVGVDKVGAYGEHPTAGPTPTLDALAARGLLFRKAYAMPTCSPTRACMLTGLYGSRTGVDTGLPHYDPLVNPNGDFAPSDDLPWIPRVLHRKGVRTAAVGKWHLTHVEVPAFQQHPIRVGFTRYDGQMANVVGGQTNYAWEHTISDKNGYFEEISTTYITLQQAGEGLGQLLAAADGGTRSFLWLAFNAPHPPWTDTPPAGTFDPAVPPFTQAELQQQVMQSADTYLGQMVAAYESMRPEAAADTLWIVLGDNGTPAAAVEAPWPGKQHKATVYEGGVRVPMIAFGPGVARGETDALVSAVDFWATLYDLFGVPIPNVLTDSISFADVLAGEAGARTTAYFRHAEPNGFGIKNWREHGATDGRWALLRRDGTVFGPAVELYDLQADPLQLVDLWPANTPEEQAAVDLLEPVLDSGDDTIP